MDKDAQFLTARVEAMEKLMESDVWSDEMREEAEEALEYIRKRIAELENE